MHVCIHIYIYIYVYMYIFPVRAQGPSSSRCPPQRKPEAQAQIECSFQFSLPSPAKARGKGSNRVLGVSASGQSSGGIKRATSVNMLLLRLQSSEGNFTMSREIEPVRRSFCRRRKLHVYGTGTFGAFWSLTLPFASPQRG